MFLDLTYSRNKKLIDFSISKHQKGEIFPDSYIIDVDTLLDNARKMLEKANITKTKLFFMLKQIGRNPYIAKKLVELGFDGAVVVDFKEAQIMMENNIPISNIGNLVQIPNSLIRDVLEYGVKYITIFSLEKAKKINDIAKELGIVQKVILRVFSKNDKLYPSQESGFDISDLEKIINEIKELENIELVGATSFPTILYDLEKEKFEKQPNFNTVLKAVDIMKTNGLNVEIVNLPSATCTRTIEEFLTENNYVGEPGHGLTGSTPAHIHEQLEEKPCVIYLSEVSHNFMENAYIYGGGHYRRSHMENVLISNGEYEIFDKVEHLDAENIDYHFRLASNHNVGDTAILAFRFQIFVTRSNVVLVENISTNPKIVGVYDSQGRKL